MKYDNNRHLMLVKFEKINKTDSKLDLELLDYEIFLQDHVYWNHRKNFIIIMGYFVDNFISYEEFEYHFSLVWRKSMEDFLKIRYDITVIKGFCPDPESNKFCGKMTAIYRHFEQLEDEFCTEEDIKIYVQKIYRNL